MSDYRLVRFALPADLEEVVTAELWSLGALGFEIQDAEPGLLRLDAYFPSPPPASLTRRRLDTWRRQGVIEIGSEILADQDWLASYRASVEPIDIGRRLRINTGDPSPSPLSGDSESSRITLQIPAQTAFGTGSHESTRLVLEWLEDFDLNGLRVLDVGTGSGILALAAERLGASQVVGFDIDAQAVCVAHGNIQLNAPTAPLRGSSTPALFAGPLAALRPQPGFDLALVNILPENFAGEVSSLTRVLAPGAKVLSSGNLVQRREELLESWRCKKFVLEAERQQAEWIAFQLVWRP